MVPSYVSGLLHHFVFFSNDVQTTAIAVAITSSLCCSVVWVLVALISGSLTPPVSSRTRHSHLVRSRSLPCSALRCHQHTMHYDESPKKNSHQVRSRSVVTPSPLWKRLQLSEQRDSRSIQSTVEKACHNKPTHINLSHLNLEYCSPRIGFVGAQLVTLNLSHNCLCHLPEEIGCLRGLANLNVSANYLHSIPRSIGNLSQLVELNISSNFLRELPSSIGGLQWLRCLRVSNNSLLGLPHSIGCLGELCELHACFNKITTLPNELCALIKLTVVHASHNPLHRLPDESGSLVRLHDLDLSSCQLSHLPRSITWCASLERLCLSNNKLLRLPGDLGRLQQLRTLQVCTNRLRHIPVCLASQKLDTFNVSHNPLLVETKAQPLVGVKSIPEDITPRVDKTHSTLTSLFHLTAQFVILNKVKWHDANMPRLVKDTLQNVQFCECCGRPLFSRYRRHLVFGSGLSFQQRLPLYQVICANGTTGVNCHFNNTLTS